MGTHKILTSLLVELSPACSFSFTAVVLPVSPPFLGHRKRQQVFKPLLTLDWLGLERDRRARVRIAATGWQDEGGRGKTVPMKGSRQHGCPSVCVQLHDAGMWSRWGRAVAWSGPSLSHLSLSTVCRPSEH